jgi:hypothetical protein
MICVPSLLVADPGHEPPRIHYILWNLESIEFSQVRLASLNFARIHDIGPHLNSDVLGNSGLCPNFVRAAFRRRRANLSRLVTLVPILYLPIL